MNRAVAMASTIKNDEERHDWPKLAWVVGSIASEAIVMADSNNTELCRGRRTREKVIGYKSVRFQWRSHGEDIGRKEIRSTPRILVEGQE